MNRRRDAIRPAWYIELAVVVFLLVVYDRVADLARVHNVAADHHGRWLIDLEQRLDVDVERWADLVVAPHLRLSQLLSIYYDFAHVTITVGVLVGVYVFAPATFRRARTVLVAVNLVSLGFFVLFPVAPPRLLPGTGIVDVVAGSGTWGSWETTRGVASHANEYASMPSLHLAWAAWVVLAIVAATPRRRYRLLAVAHLVMTAVVVVATGNHYVLDVVIGVALTVVLWAVAGVGCKRISDPLSPALPAERRSGPRRSPRAAATVLTWCRGRRVRDASAPAPTGPRGRARTRPRSGRSHVRAPGWDGRSATGSPPPGSP